jgi:hypothetical protein
VPEKAFSLLFLEEINMTNSKKHGSYTFEAPEYKSNYDLSKVEFDEGIVSPDKSKIELNFIAPAEWASQSPDDVHSEISVVIFVERPLAMHIGISPTKYLPNSGFTNYDWHDMDLDPHTKTELCMIGLSAMAKDSTPVMTKNDILERVRLLQKKGLTAKEIKFVLNDRIPSTDILKEVSDA